MWPWVQAHYPNINILCNTNTPDLYRLGCYAMGLLMSDSVWNCGRSLVLWVPGTSGSIENGILGEYFPEREYNLLDPKRTRKRPKFQPWVRPPLRLAPEWVRAPIQKPACCLSRDEAVDTRVSGPRSTGDLWGQVNDPKMAKMRVRR